MRMKLPWSVAVTETARSQCSRRIPDSRNTNQAATESGALITGRMVLHRHRTAPPAPLSSTRQRGEPFHDPVEILRQDVDVGAEPEVVEAVLGDYPGAEPVAAQLALQFRSGPPGDGA